MKKRFLRAAAVCMALALIGAAALADGVPAADPSPAVYVAWRTQHSVVGILTSYSRWDAASGEMAQQPVSSGSGVVVKEGGYILTNYHVLENGNVYQVLMPDGEYADAEYIGADSTLDIGVLRVESDQLEPVEIGSVADLVVGSTVVAIGNPGGETLANTVTQGIVSALERDVRGSNTKRAVSYIQHDAAISSGSSGGGLFDYRGRLVGINTLKYAASSYSSATYEGLGFALPVDTVIPLVEQIIEHGKVIRPQMGVMTLDWEGPAELNPNYPPAGVLIAEVVADTPAERAGIQLYDFIIKVDGERVTCYRELSTILDGHEPGDTVTITVARYGNIEAFLYHYYNGTAANGLFGAYYNQPALTGVETVDIDVTLEILDLD